MVSVMEQCMQTLSEDKLRSQQICSNDGCEPLQRTLIHIPIVHTQADMGALRESIQRLKVNRLGRKGWERNVDLVDRLWT